MTTPVSFEIAKLLKERGFPQITDSGWVEQPSIGEVVEWLLEKHSIWVQVTVSSTWVGNRKEPHAKFNSETVSRNRNFKVKTLIETRVRMEPYDSPKEAYEAGIEYALNNLI